MAPAKPALDRDRSQRHFLVAAGAGPGFRGGGTRPPSRRAPPPRSAPLRSRRHRRPSDGGAPRAAPPASQRHFLVAVGVAFDFLGGGLRPPSEPPPFDGAGNAGARTEVQIAQRSRPHSVTSLWRWAWHSMVTAAGRGGRGQG